MSEEELCYTTFMKVVLLSDVKGLGVFGAVCSVSDGYALNFLIPKQQAVEASSERGKQLLQQVGTRREQTESKAIDAEALFAALPASVTVTEKANEQGTLFQAVTQAHIITALSENGYTTLPEWFSPVSLKEVGEHSVTVQWEASKKEILVQIVGS